MSLDSQISLAIIELNKEIYQDGDTPQNGSDALLEMISVIKETISSKKYTLSDKLTYLTNRQSLLNNFQANLDAIVESTQLQQKYEIFRRNSEKISSISGSMDNVNSKINIHMKEIMRKIRDYRREYDEISYRITKINENLTWYKSANEELEELENLLQE